jgi:DNA-binding NarL/FixJ family response regulator
VLLADDNQLFRTGFRAILERESDLEVVGEARNGRQAVALAKKLQPAVVLMDLAMPVLNGLQATRQIVEAVPATKVLMLSAHSDNAYVEEAINSGAIGYVIKQTDFDSVCFAVREVQKGNTFFSPSIPRRLHKLSPKNRGAQRSVAFDARGVGKTGVPKKKAMSNEQ